MSARSFKYNNLDVPPDNRKEEVAIAGTVGAYVWRNN